MGTLNSVDVINQHYELQLDLFESSYASLCAETIDRRWKRMRFQNIIMTYFNLFFPKLTKEPLHN